MNIWINGVFDILHTGHIDLFWYAKLYQNYTIPLNLDYNKLYVGIDTDERVKFLKGDKRPINNVKDRAKMLSNLKMIDGVVTFSTDDELRYHIRNFDIDYMVLGDHYVDKTVIGAECPKFGVIYYPTDNRSTTNIIEKIKKL